MKKPLLNFRFFSHSLSLFPHQHPRPQPSTQQFHPQKRLGPDYRAREAGIQCVAGVVEGDVAIGGKDGVLVRDVGAWVSGWLGLGLGGTVADLEGSDAGKRDVDRMEERRVW